MVENAAPFILSCAILTFYRRELCFHEYDTAILLKSLVQVRFICCIATKSDWNYHAIL